MNIKLYDYQEVAHNNVVNALRKYGRALMVMATGLGKTVVSAKIVEYFLAQLKSKPRILFLCHDTGILEQCYKKYQTILGDKYTYARFYGQKKNWNADKHNFVFATFQSKPHQFFRASHFDYIIVDESHHAKAETYDEVLDYFNVKWELGMTATPDREDQKDIRDRFGEEVVNYSLAEAIANGWVTPIEYKVMTDGIDKDVLQQLVQDVLVEEIKVNEKQLNDWIFVRSRTEVQCREILNYTNQNLKAIVFCNNIMHLEHIQVNLPNSVIVHSGQSAKMNALAIAQYEAGIARHILVVDKFNEGIDLPDTDILVFLRGTDSFRIWAQQLGRGLRKYPGKEKVIVLDFVANIERIRDVRKLVSDIAHFQKTKGEFDEMRINAPLHIEGAGFMFDFTEEVVSVLSTLDYMDKNKVAFYETWQEASEAAIRLGIKTISQYKLRYKEDGRLSSHPEHTYRDKDFPGYNIFFGRIINDPYPTWQEASEAAIRLGATSRASYLNVYREDNRLRSIPDKIYEDFPGFEIFLKTKKSFYPTWQEASEAAIRLGIKTQNEYLKRCKEDPKLVVNIYQFYEDFPGFEIFLKTKKSFYPTWQEASEAAIRLGIINGPTYVQKRHLDPNLPGAPVDFYEDFPNWFVFLGRRKKEFYKTLEEVYNAIDKIGITNGVDYSKKRHLDPKLPSSIEDYYKDFPGWGKFLKKEESYKTWQEASSIVIKAGITSRAMYLEKYKNVDKRLVKDVAKKYSDFPGWNKFLGLKAPEGWYCKYDVCFTKHVDTSTIETFVKKYRKTHSKWFKQYARYHSKVEHYHPDLVKLIIEFLRSRKTAPKGWENAPSIAKRFSTAGETVKNFIKPYRSKHPQWFKTFVPPLAGPMCEYYHPSLIKKIEEEFSSRKEAPEDWRNAQWFVDNGMSRLKLFKLLDPYRISNRNWFKQYKPKNGPVCEHFHPDLVEKIKEHFKK